MFARAFVFVFAVAVPSLASLSVATDARASVSIAVTFDGLVRETSVAAIVTPIEQRALWENGRIYTYTRVSVDRVLAGDVVAEAWVRTMGGIVGKIGQIVDGEAVLTMGRPSLLFLHPGPANVTTAFEVTARGQGQFPIVLDEKKATRIIRASNVGVLLPPAPPRPTTARNTGATSAPVLAADVLHGRLVDDAAREVASAYKRLHASK
jgi:hypothetical protein